MVDFLKEMTGDASGVAQFLVHPQRMQIAQHTTRPAFLGISQLSMSQIALCHLQKRENIVCEWQKISVSVALTAGSLKEGQNGSTKQKGFRPFRAPPGQPAKGFVGHALRPQLRQALQGQAPSFTRQSTCDVYVTARRVASLCASQFILS